MAFLEFFINEVENIVKLLTKYSYISGNNFRYIESAWLVLASPAAILSAGIFDIKDCLDLLPQADKSSDHIHSDGQREL